MADIWQNTVSWLHLKGLSVALIALLAIISLVLTRVFIHRLITVYKSRHDDRELHKRAETLGAMCKYIIVISILFMAAMLLLDQFGIQLGPLLAAAGVIGIAVGFGAQHLVQDVTNGFFIMLDDEIRVGDVVEVAGKWGTVERVNLRQTVLRNIDGNVHFIPNSQIGVVTNMSKVYSYCLMQIGVAYRENIDEVFEVMELVAEELRKDEVFGKLILEPIDIMGLDDFGDSALVVKARIKVQPSRQFKVKREFFRRLKVAFDERNIEIPFPHRTVYMGQDKAGKAPSLHVSVKDKSESESGCGS
ncbi:MAG: mechanosensitive ion channel family protein [Candidatus Zixiibacteriota bacterium]